MFTVFGQRFNKIDPIIATVSTKEVAKGTVLCDGEPEKISLGSWTSESTAEHMAENIKNNVPKRSWRIWVEKA